MLNGSATFPSRRKRSATCFVLRATSPRRSPPTRPRSPLETASPKPTLEMLGGRAAFPPRKKRSATCSSNRATSPEALAAYKAALAIRDRLAKADPGNAGWQFDLGISHERIGAVLQAQGNLPGALKEF